MVLQARQSVRFEWNGQIPDPFKARAKILKLIKAVSGSHEACGDDQRLEERHSLANSIGDVFNKVCIIFVMIHWNSHTRFISEVFSFGMTVCNNTLTANPTLYSNGVFCRHSEVGLKLLIIYFCICVS